jgi:hypothetical protein
MNIKGKYRKPLPDASKDEARMRIEHERANNVLRGEIQDARDYTDSRITEMAASLQDILGQNGIDWTPPTGRK